MERLDDEGARPIRPRLDVVSAIMAWEGGTITADREAELFQYLLDSGTIHRLQGMYGRRAQQLIDAGVIHPPGRVGDLDASKEEMRSDRRAGKAIDVATINEDIRQGRKKGGAK